MAWISAGDMYLQKLSFHDFMNRIYQQYTGKVGPLRRVRAAPKSEMEPIRRVRAARQSLNWSYLLHTPSPRPFRFYVVSKKTTLTHSLRWANTKTIVSGKPEWQGYWQSMV